jgi:hypothetical protein
MSTRTVVAIRTAGDFSVPVIRDEAIPLNPWHDNEAKPNHSSVIAMEHELLIDGQWPRERHLDNFMLRGESVPDKTGAVCKKRFGEVE